MKKLEFVRVWDHATRLYTKSKTGHDASYQAPEQLIQMQSDGLRAVCQALVDFVNHEIVGED